MSASYSFDTGGGTSGRKSHVPPVPSSPVLTTQAKREQLPAYPFQPLPPPIGPAPYRYDLSQLLSASDISGIKAAGVMTVHTVGDTGDFRGQQQDFVAEMLTQDALASPDTKKPAFFYRLGDVVYFAGDVDMYGDNFYETYKDYPGFIVGIPGNHDCQPDDPADGPVNPKKYPLDGWVQNFMSKSPAALGSLKTGAGRTQMDLPNVYWTLTTPFATIIGLFSNVGESQGAIHPDQATWLEGELKAADPALALIVTVHHPPFSGDIDHSGSSEVDRILSAAFKAANRYPNLILSGHVHNYQRFTNTFQDPTGKPLQVPCVVAGAGGYTKLGKMPKLKGQPPQVPLKVYANLTLEQFDDENFGFIRLEIDRSQITGTYYSAPYVAGSTPKGVPKDSFSIDIGKHTVRTLK